MTVIFTALHLFIKVGRYLPSAFCSNSRRKRMFNSSPCRRWTFNFSTSFIIELSLKQPFNVDLLHGTNKRLQMLRI